MAAVVQTGRAAGAVLHAAAHLAGWHVRDGKRDRRKGPGHARGSRGGHTWGVGKDKFVLVRMYAHDALGICQQGSR